METIFNFWSNLSHQSVQLAINAIWIGLALTGAAWLMLRCAGYAAAAARSLLWWTVLIVVLALPLLAVSPLDNWLEAARSQSQPSTTVAATIEQPEQVMTTPVERRTIRPPAALLASPIRPQAEARLAPTEPPPQPSTLALRLIPLSLTLIWLTGSLLIIGRLILAYRRMVAIRDRSEAFDSSHLVNFDQLRRAEKRPVEVRLSHDTAVPIAAGLGHPTILIPHHLAEALSPRELEAVMMHELAHLKRWDDWSKLAQKLIEALFFFHPAVHIICYQLELERELACDEWAIAQTGPADHYARCLTRLVQLSSGTATTLIPGALSGRKQIFRRFERLLVQTSSSRRERRTGLKLGGLAALVLVSAFLAVQVVPAIGLPLEPVQFAELVSVEDADHPTGDDQQESEGTRKSESSSTSLKATEVNEVTASKQTRSSSRSSVNSTPMRTIGRALVDGDKVYGATTSTRGKTVTTQYRDDDQEISLEVQGQIELARDSRSLQSLGKDAVLELTKSSEGQSWRLRIENHPDREPQYTYFVNDEYRDYDSKAQEWFAATLSYFVAKTGYGAQARLHEIITDDGLQACLDYIEDEVEDQARRYYYEQLMAFEHLGFSDLRQIRRHAGETLSDDYDIEYVRDEVDRRTAYMREHGQNLWSGDDTSLSGRTRYRSSSRSRASRSSGDTDEYFRWSDDNDASGYAVWSGDDEDTWSYHYGSGNTWTSFVGDSWSRRDHDTEGEWEARFKRSRNRVQLELEDYDGDYRISFPVMLDELSGLTSDHFLNGSDKITFEYKLDAGTFHFSGDFSRGRGGGEFTFESNPEFVESLKSLGYKTTRLSDWRLFELAIHDVSLDYIKQMNDQGLGNLRLDKLVEMRIHGIEPEYVAEFARLGYDDLSSDDLIAFAIHDVDPEFVQEMTALNVRGLDGDAIVQLAIHDIDADYVREMAAIGYDGLSVDDLVQFGIHDVDPQLVKELQDLNVRGLDEEAMVQLSIHDIDADYVREMAAIGYDGFSVEDLVQFGIHDVDPKLVQELRGLNVRGLDEEAMVQLSIHGIDADFVREFAEIGYDGLSTDILVQFGIHDVDPDLVRELRDLDIHGMDEEAIVQMSIHDIDADFVREFAEIGYNRLSVERLVEFGIHNVTPKYVSDLAELGYKDVDPDDLVAMKIHGVTPSFIRRVQRKGYDDLSTDDLIDIKIHGYY